MKKILLLCCLSISFFSNAQTGTSINDSLLSDGVIRNYRVYIPQSYDGSSSVPLIMNFHGLGSNNLMQESHTEFNNVADTANVIVVYPQGLTLPLLGTGWDNFIGPSNSIKDINFASNLIDSLKTAYNINMSRIYCTGMSNGGFMSLILSCQLSERINAIASVTGSIVASELDVCNTTHKMPFMQIHGTSDPIVGYDGTGGWIAAVPIDSLIAHWVDFNECNLPPTIDTLTDMTAADSSRAVHFVWNNCADGSSVEFYKIVGGGHTWPGAQTEMGGVDQVGFKNMDFSATEQIWRFFSQQKSFVGVNELREDSFNFEILPNPNSGTFSLEFLGNVGSNYRLTVFDLSGSEVYRQENGTGSSLTQINLGDIASGLYFLRLHVDNQVKVKKLIVW